MTESLDFTRRTNVIQGEYAVTRDPAMVLTALLGSCVAACIRDPVAGIGGMNHFLVPGVDPHQRLEAERYGVHLMELLVNELMRSGAQRSRLQAKLFGGARMMRGLSDIGHKNAVFAEHYLQHEGIPVTGSDVGGERGRRIQFWPVSGRVRRSFVPNHVESAPPQLSIPLAGEPELF
jgi:chemotaxis protein CheD